MKIMYSFPYSVAIASCGIGINVATAQTAPSVRPSVNLVSDTAADYDVMGFSLALSDNTLVAGGPGIDLLAKNAGGAVFFTRDGEEWTEDQVLGVSGSAEGDEFGFSVSLDGVRLVLGGPRADTDAGADAGRVGVFAFNGDSWAESTVLSAGTAQADAEFGTSVAVSGPTIVVGAPLHDTNIRDEGMVFVYRFIETAWQLEAELIAPDAYENDRFGTSVAIDGGRIVVGMPRDDDAGIDGGAAWVFQRVDGSWQPETKLVRNENDWSANFGCSVDIDGTTIAVGADRDDVFGVDDGAIRVFDLSPKDGWVQTAILGPQESDTSGREFGFSVTLDGNRLLGGMPVDGLEATNAGAGVLFANGATGWLTEAIIRSQTSSEQSLFGTSVAAFEGRIALGAPLASEAAQYAGAVSVINLNVDCDEDGVPDVISIASGAVEDLNGDGVVDSCICQGDLFADDVVDGADLGLMLVLIGRPCGEGTTNPDCTGDLDGDGAISGADLGLILASWGPCN